VLACLYAAKKNGGRVALPTVGKDFGEMFESLLPKEVTGTFLYRYIKAGIRDGEIEPNRKAIMKLEYYEGIKVGAKIATAIFDALQIEGVVKIWAKLPTPLARIKAAIHKAKSVPTGLSWNLSLFNLTGLRNADDPTEQLRKNLTQVLYTAATLTPATPNNNIKAPIYTTVFALPARIPEITNKQVNSLIEFVDQRLNKLNENNIVEAKRPLSQEILYNHHAKFSNVPDYKNDDIAQKVIDADKGVFVIVATHGTGKTSVIGKGCVDNAKQAQQKPLYISHRVTLSRDASTALQVKNYQDWNPQDKENHKINDLSICVNSIINGKYDGFTNKSKVLLLDEVSQIYRHIAVGSVADNLRALVYKLQGLIRSADKVIATDADIDDLTIQQLQLARPNEKFHIHVNTHRKGVNQKIYVHTHEGAVVESMQADLRGGKNVFTMSDNKKVVESFEQLAGRVLNESDNFACITSDNTKNTENRSLIRDINSELIRFGHRFLAASPAISSGVSIVTPHFNQHFGFFYGMITPKDAWQQLRRDRTAQEYHVFVSSKAQGFETNPEVIKQEITAANNKTRAILGMEEIENYQHSDFDELRLAVTVQDNADRNDFANRFLRLAQFDGIQIEYMDVESDDKLLKEIKELAQAKTMEAIMNPEVIIDDEQASRLLRMNDRTSGQTYALTNWLIRDHLAVENVSEDEVNFWDDGRGWRQLKMLELATTSRDVIMDFDKLEQNNADYAQTTKSFFILKRGFIRYLLEFIGASFGDDGSIDVSNVEYTSDQCVKSGFIQKLIAQQDEFNACHLGRKITDKTITMSGFLIRSVLNNMGLYTKTKQVRKNTHRQYVHTIDLEKSQYALEALARRQAANRNFFREVVEKAAAEEMAPAQVQPTEETKETDTSSKILTWLHEQKAGVVFKVKFLARQVGINIEIVLGAIVDLYAEGVVRLIDDGTEPHGKVALA